MADRPLRSTGRRTPGPALVTAILLAPIAFIAAARAQEPGSSMLSPGRVFAEQGGARLFANICQGCHMADARGAAGAGAYPSLAADANLGVAAYPVAVVVKGLRAMPPIGRAMTDDQVAAVVNYLRSHFDNHFADPVSPEDVRAARP